MPRKPRNPGTGKPPHNGPATGTIATPVTGRGWGGDANGPGVPFTADHQPAPMTAEAREERRLADIADEEEALRFYTSVGRDETEFKHNRMIAYEKLLDRTKGKPVQATQNTHSGPDNGPVSVIVIPAKAP